MGVFTSDVLIDAGGNTVQVSNFPAVQSISGTVTSIQGAAAALAGAWPVELTDGANILGTVAHPLVTQENAPASSVSAVTQVIVAANTNVTVLAANPNRKAASIFCPASTLQVKFGAGASATSFTRKVTANNTTIDIDISGVVWTGQIDVFGAAQTVTVTELT